jgi:hypothetical protein
MLACQPDGRPENGRFCWIESNALYVTLLKLLVPTARLELAQLSPLPPQDSVSTNFTTSAHSPTLSLFHPLCSSTPKCLLIVEVITAGFLSYFLLT